MGGEKRGMVSVANIFSKSCLLKSSRKDTVMGQGWERKQTAFKMEDWLLLGMTEKTENGCGCVEKGRLLQEQSPRVGEKGNGLEQEEGRMSCPS